MTPWIFCARVWTTHEEYLVVFVTVKNLVRIVQYFRATGVQIVAISITLGIGFCNSVYYRTCRGVCVVLSTKHQCLLVNCYCCHLFLHSFCHYSIFVWVLIIIMCSV